MEPGAALQVRQGMRLPFINTDAELLNQVQTAGESIAPHGSEAWGGSGSHFRVTPIGDRTKAIEYINYQMPPLILINFSDEEIDSFGIMKQIVEDPWLNYGAIIAFFRDSGTLEKINQLEDTNIVLSLQFGEIAQQFPNVLEVVGANPQILFQRAMHKDLLSDISGHFVIANDISIVPFYANLIANYLYNLDFIERERKLGIHLSLSEMLINAIEHGNCGIGGKEKGEALEKGLSIPDLIRERTQDPAVSARRVHFQYAINRDHSSYVIRDEGKGFDWRSHVDVEEVDILAQHGRGIWMTSGNVDRIEYNDAGNMVTLTVQHRKNMTNSIPLAFGDSELVDFEPGEIVFREGEESTFLYYIAEGEFRVETNNRTLATMNPADILLGEMSFLLEESRSATVIANSPGKLIKISKETFVENIKSNPHYGLFLAKLIAQRLQRLSQRFSS